MTMQATSPRLILASASAARQALLRQAGLVFDVEAAAIDEAGVKQAAQAEGAGATDTALLLAELKAQRVSRRHPEAMVIGCDQLLVCGERWFDKPPDLQTAREHLRVLRGHTHTLATAVVCQRAGQPLWHDVSRQHLTMRLFDDAFLDDYIATEAAALTHTVGAYRFEGPGIQLFDRIEGDHAAILGLPLLPLLGFLRQHRILT